MIKKSYTKKIKIAKPNGEDNGTILKQFTWKFKCR